MPENAEQGIASTVVIFNRAFINPIQSNTSSCSSMQYKMAQIFYICADKDHSPPGPARKRVVAMESAATKIPVAAMPPATWKNPEPGSVEESREMKNIILCFGGG
jgi:hypothetical protein